MRPATPFSFHGIEGDIARLDRLLALGLRAVDWRPRDPIAILNLACGRADETGILLKQLAPPSRRLFYLGLDLRAPEIAEARARWLPHAHPDHEIDFRVGDASLGERMRLLPTIDFIFVRHQNYWADAPVWTRLYRNALDALKPGGLITLTSYFDQEHEFANTCLSQLGARKLADLPHPQSRPLPDAPGKSVDRHLSIWRVPQAAPFEPGAFSAGL